MPAEAPGKYRYLRYESAKTLPKEIVEKGEQIRELIVGEMDHSDKRACRADLLDSSSELEDSYLFLNCVTERVGFEVAQALLVLHSH